MCLQLTPQYASFAAWHSHVHGQAGNIAWYWGRGGINTTFAAKENAPGDFADQALTQPAAIDGYLLPFPCSSLFPSNIPVSLSLRLAISPVDKGTSSFVGAGMPTSSSV